MAGKDMEQNIIILCVLTENGIQLFILILLFLWRS